MAYLPYVGATQVARIMVGTSRLTAIFLSFEVFIFDPDREIASGSVYQAAEKLPFPE